LVSALHDARDKPETSAAIVMAFPSHGVAGTASFGISEGAPADGTLAAVYCWDLGTSRWQLA
jgi:hypothetical protein